MKKWIDQLGMLLDAEVVALKEAVQEEYNKRFLQAYLTKEERQMSKIDGIKSVRSRTGLSLPQAKSYYELVKDAAETE